MTNIWEQNIKEWYEKSETSRLNYLDLSTTVKPSSKELAHNIAVIYDRVCLLSKVSLKESRHLATENQLLKVSLEKLQIKIIRLEKEVINLTSFLLAQKPLTKQEVRDLVAELTHQSRNAENQAVDLLQKVQEKVDSVEAVLQQLKQVVLG